MYYSYSSEPLTAARSLATELGLSDYEHDARTAAQLDFYTQVLDEAKILRLSPAKTSAVLKVADDLLELCKGGSLVTDVEANLRSSMLSMCKAKPMEADQCLSPDQISAITQFFIDCFLTNYRLFQHMYTQEQAMTSYSVELLVETPVVPSFDQAMPEDHWKQHQQRLQQEAEEQQRTADQKRQHELEEARLQALQREREEAESEWAARMAKKPATLEEAVEHLVSKRLDQEKAKLEEDFKHRQEELQAQIKLLQSKLPS